MIRRIIGQLMLFWTDQISPLKPSNEKYSMPSLGRCEKVKHQELRADFDEPDIVTVIKVQQLMWSGHMADMTENRSPQCYSETI